MGFLDRAREAAANVTGRVDETLPASLEHAVMDSPAATGPAARRTPPNDVSVTSWDYRAVAMGEGCVGWSDDEINLHDLEAQLCHFGREGWELVDIWFDRRLRVKQNGHLMVFRRRVVSGVDGSNGSDCR
jgi:hypothetical protein